MNYLDKYIPAEGNENARIYIVGEAPGATEHDEGRPFVGESGRLLRDTISRHGIPASDCYITNLFHYRPLNNNFKGILGEDKLKTGLLELYGAIKRNRPNIVVALGAYPLQYLTGKIGIKKWRGSILSTIVDSSIKCIPTIHPAAILRDGSLYPTFDIDIKRIASDSTYPEKRLPERQFIINPRGLELEQWEEKLINSEYLGIDIETIKNSSRILCVGFSPASNIAVCLSADSEWNRRSIGRILADGRAKKIFQFGTFDTLQLISLNGYKLSDTMAEELQRPYYWDTNNAQHILAPELPRSLEYLTSIYTREPYYKTVGRGTIPDDEKGWSDKVEKQGLYEYNCRDCCCTLEIALEQMKEIGDDPIFNFSMSQLSVSLHISSSGMLVDDVRRKLIEKGIYHKMNKKQFVLNMLCQEKDVNVRSTKLKKILFEKLGLPARFKKDNHGKQVQTTDEDAIVSLIGVCKGKMNEYKTQEKKVEWEAKLTICKLILEIRGLRVLISNYIKEFQRNKVSRTGTDGRIRSTFKVCGTETGRWSCSKYVDGTGFNAQTLPRDPFEMVSEAELGNVETFEIEEEDDESEEEQEEVA